MRKWLLGLGLIATAIAAFGIPSPEGSIYDSGQGRASHYIQGYIRVGNSVGSPTPDTIDLDGSTGEGIFVGSVTAPNITYDETDLVQLNLSTAANYNSIISVNNSLIAHEVDDLAQWTRVNITTNALNTSTAAIQTQLNLGFTNVGLATTTLSASTAAIASSMASQFATVGGSTKTINDKFTTDPGSFTITDTRGLKADTLTASWLVISSTGPNLIDMAMGLGEGRGIRMNGIDSTDPKVKIYETADTGHLPGSFLGAIDIYGAINPSSPNNYIPNTHFTGMPSSSSYIGNGGAGKLGVNTAYPGYTLDVGGDINTQGNYYVSGVPIGVSLNVSTGPFAWVRDDLLSQVDGSKTHFLLNYAQSSTQAVIVVLNGLTLNYPNDFSMNSNAIDMVKAPETTATSFFLRYVINSSTALAALETGSSAGGDLSGTYPNPTVVKATNGLTVGTVSNTDKTDIFLAGYRSDAAIQAQIVQDSPLYNWAMGTDGNSGWALGLAPATSNTVLSSTFVYVKGSNGNVGIGTANPGSALDVVSGGNKVLTMGAWTAWTPTVGGCSGSATITLARYVLVGKSILFSTDISCTSNATSFTATLPLSLTAQNASNVVVCDTEDNGLFITTLGIANTNVSSNIFNFYKDGSLGNWTAIGIKRAICTGIFEVN